MPLGSRLANLWRDLFHRNRLEQEFIEELQAYLELLTRAKILEGLQPQDARRAALIELGGVEQVKESVREVRMGYFVETIWQDFRYGIRVLLKSPVFTTVAVLSLALGIGANTAIFSVVNGLLLRPLPYPESDRIMNLWHTPPQESFPGMNKFSVSPGNYLDWKDQNYTFEQMAVYGYASLSMRTGDTPVPVVGAAVSADFFSVLRMAPSHGRTFAPEEEQPGRDQAVVISHGLWKRAFGGDPDLIGRTVTLNSRSFTVVGIMPAGFQFPSEAELWVPMVWEAPERQTRSIHDYLVIGRLKPGVPVAEAQAEMNTISSRLEQQYPEDNRGWGAVVIPLQEDLVGDVRPALLVLFSAVAFVLLIACANVANLMLARGANRQKEIAVRTALGASRARVVRQLLSESILLAIVGGLLGLLLASWGSRLLIQLSSDSLPNSGEIGLDYWALGFTILVSLGAGLAAGIAPALQYTKAEMNEALKQGTGRTGGSFVKQRTRKALVICEVALSLILLIGAGLMIRSFWKLQQVDPGFNPGNAVAMSIGGLAPARYSDPNQQALYFERVLEQVRAIPGVVAVGATTNLPLTGSGSTQPFEIEGRPAMAVSEQPMADVRCITQDYFRAIGIPLRQGRFFGDQDNDSGAPVAIISEAMARIFWPGEDPVGRRLTLSFFLQQGPRQIVGVVGDVRRELASEPQPMIYLPHKQISRPWMTFVARTASDPENFIPSISQAAHSVDTEQAIWDVKPLEEVLANSLSRRRFNMTLLITFAGLALVLAAAGVYGLMNYAVTLRRREIGIRMALGARTEDVLRLILGQGLILTLTGVAAGLMGAYGLTRLMESLLYGVTATDWLTFASVAGVLILVGLLASYLPARRAMKVDPMIALRSE